MVELIHLYNKKVGRSSVSRNHIGLKISWKTISLVLSPVVSIPSLNLFC